MGLCVVVGADPVPVEGDGDGARWVARVDGAGLAEAADVFARFREALRLPDWSGANWDALDDSLRDLAWLPADGCLIDVAAAQRMLAERPRERAVLLDVLARADAAWAARGGPFTVVLRCATPEQAAGLRAEIAALGHDG
ncbi:barstar family protein [Streptomyces specialis]|uniref:barstar family protein n=1 Tax=Streptomyces specialis TaxID=498367 RepID=UPI00073EEB99|nr:barstar family protein [Streptomyces specialis]